MSDTRRLTALTLVLGNGLIAFLAAALVPITPDMAAYFGGNNADALSKLALVAPALPMALAAPFMGALTNKAGLRRVYLTALLLFGVFGTAGYLAQSFHQLLTTRFLLGFAAAGIGASGITLATRLFEGTARNKLLGYQGATAAAGGIFAMVAAGFLGEISWRMPFLIHLCALFMLPLALTQIPKVGAPDVTSVKGSFNRTLALIYAIAAFAAILLFLAPVHVPFLVKELGLTGSTSRMVAVLPSIIASTLVSSCYGIIRRYLKPWPIIGLMFTLVGTGALMIGLAASFPGLLVGMAVIGSGMGLVFPNITSMVADRTDGKLRSIAMGGVLTATFAGEFLSPIVTQPLAAALGEAAMFRMLGTGVTVLGIVLLMVLLVKRR